MQAPAFAPLPTPQSVPAAAGSGRGHRQQAHCIPSCHAAPSPNTGNYGIAYADGRLHGNSTPCTPYQIVPFHFTAFLCAFYRTNSSHSRSSKVAFCLHSDTLMPALPLSWNEQIHRCLDRLYGTLPHSHICHIQPNIHRFVMLLLPCRCLPLRVRGPLCPATPGQIIGIKIAMMHIPCPNIVNLVM